MRRQARITCLVGTRPEAIKMAPVVRELRRRAWAKVRVLATSQHRELLAPFLDLFEIPADVDLDVMTDEQTLPSLTSRLIEQVSAALAADRPDLVVGQGDTTSVMATAMSCFYAKIPFAHVEAGLRTGDLQQPFPEEFNRVVASRIASFNFAPTDAASANLLREGADPKTVFVTGNTVIDALRWTIAHHPKSGISLAPGQRLMLVTLHRRESFGAPLAGVFSAVRQLIDEYPQLVAVYPVHPNPNVAGPARALLGGIGRLHLVAPFDYPQFVAVMQQADVILTDSGGIQEEATALGKPVLVARDKTERPEAVAAGLSRLIGTDPERLCREARKLLDRTDQPTRSLGEAALYGDGRASERIADILEASFGIAEPNGHDRSQALGGQSGENRLADEAS